MSNIFHSLILGIVQGVTEFLPISSSAHLRLVPFLFNWPTDKLAFDVSLHFGTAIAILAYYWRDWISLFTKAFHWKSKEAISSETDQFPDNLLWQILIATIPAGIAGVLLSKIEDRFGILLIAINLAVFGIIIALVDKYAKESTKPTKLTYKQTFLVGLSQCLALIPGVSRSGITILSSRFLGLPRETAARFSFMLGTPAMIGAFLFELRHINSSDLTLAFFLAVAASAISGFFAIRFLLNYLKRGNLNLFAWYRLAFALVIILIYLIRI
ncbi:MAG: undecaprenyl-diphosphatase UppP [Candidatus Berkelbacteria bacterium]|nr:undecaprenyl-diphosphatase UppP [Candidatus Berkelbacteria bacterium]